MDAKRARNNSSSGAMDALLERVRRVTEDRFEILGLLGKGGMAAVYLARDLELDREVAIKVMLEQSELTVGMSERFAREAKTAAKLDHANVIRVYEVKERSDPMFLVMQRIDGASLEQVASRLESSSAAENGRMPITAVQSALYQVALGLEHAHAAQVVHRDMKPNNVMITTAGVAIITDFGIAKVMVDVNAAKSSALLGTLTYMSPEQCKGRPVSGASDQYSLGVMAYELLVGEPPFTGNQYEVQQAHVHEEPRSLVRRRTDIPPALAATVMQMLAKREVDRFDSMSDVVRALGEGFDHLDPEPARILGAAAQAARDGVALPERPRTPVPKKKVTSAESSPQPRPVKERKSTTWRPSAAMSKRVGLALVVVSVVGAVSYGVAKTARKAPAPIDSAFGRSMRTALANDGYSLAGTPVVEEFSGSVSRPGANIRDGRLLPDGDSTNATRDPSKWNVASSELAAHFDVKYEGGGIAKGSGLYVGASARSDRKRPCTYLILIRATTPGSYRLVQRIGRSVRDVAPPTSTLLLGPGINRVDMLVTAGVMRVYINDALATTVPSLPCEMDGTFGVYVSPGEQYSFNNIVVSAVKRN